MGESIDKAEPVDYTPHGDEVPASPSNGEGDLSAAVILSRTQVYGLVGTLVLLSNVPLVCLIWLWPEAGDLDGRQAIFLFGWRFSMTPEHRVLLCVTFCGLLGGSIRMLMRIRFDFTSADVSSQYISWYFLTPPIGAIISVGFYLVVRGGFLASGTSIRDVNIFAFGGVGVLAGLFAEDAVERLGRAFSAAFSSRE